MNMKKLSAAAAVLITVLALAQAGHCDSLEARQAKGLRNYEPYTAVQMERARISPAGAEAVLEKGLQASPDFPPVYFQLASRSHSKTPFVLIPSLPDSIPDFSPSFPGPEAAARNSPSRRNQAKPRADPA